MLQDFQCIKIQQKIQKHKSKIKCLNLYQVNKILLNHVVCFQPLLQNMVYLDNQLIQFVYLKVQEQLLVVMV